MGTNDSLLKDYPTGVYANFCAKQEHAEANAEEQAENSEEEEKLDAKVQEMVKKDSSMNRSDSMNLSRKLSIKETVDPVELEKKEKADENDAKVADEAKKLAEEYKKVGGFTKLMEYNKPKVLILIGVLMTIPSGLANPICGIAFAKIMTFLSIPIEFLKFIDPAGVGGV